MLTESVSDPRRANWLTITSMSEDVCWPEEPSTARPNWENIHFVTDPPACEQVKGTCSFRPQKSETWKMSKQQMPLKHFLSINRYVMGRLRRLLRLDGFGA
ncbi:unnamed protein product [Larinioides sclopetarius]|uniref:Uncharacterized protein n=1 Tax=Larinioides sclopetarius TaxID=280406 RepID=A0AAV2BP60_9ARAC